MAVQVLAWVDPFKKDVPTPSQDLQDRRERVQAQAQVITEAEQWEAIGAPTLQ
jgi:hypothetical protein